ncbi:MAG: type VI secretion system tip protein VgrG [bacterium]|nr:type VI secretion system tip protein VgrG [bacterium]
MSVEHDISEAQLAFEVDGLSADQLLVVRYCGTEALAQLYRFDVEVATSESELYLDDIVGRAAKLTVSTAFGDRWFHGIVSRFELTGESPDQRYFRAELVPEVWLLTQRYDSRIFQNMSVPEIVTEVLTAAGIDADHCRLDLQGTYPAREYCVQYRETDYNFIARLMEHAGIWWAFEQTADGHQMVCGDSPVACPAIEDGSELPYVPATGLSIPEEHVAGFRVGLAMRPGSVGLNDFDFTNPKLDLHSAASAERDAGLAHHDCPGEYASQADGTGRVQLRLEEFEAGRIQAAGESNCHRLSPGRTFDLIEHPCEALNSGFLVTLVTHQGRQSTHRTATGTNGTGSLLNGHDRRWSQSPIYHAGRFARELDPAGANGEGQPLPGFDQPAYRCRFSCIPASVTFRPARSTPWPDLRGSQTARVVGPASEEIYTDEYGRVKVQFNWDRRQGFDENASCWIRVSQGMAGGQYGMMFLPRVGQEVVVDFLEGNPDKPIIVGRVYNADHMPPYTLPDDKTKSVIRTQSSKGGGGCNEIRFEDLKDNEQLLLFAQKDLHLRAQNDRVEAVGNDRHLSVGNDRVESVKNDYSLKIEKGSQITEVGSDHSLAVKGKASVQIDGTHSIQVGGDVVQGFSNNCKTEVSGISTSTAASIKLEASAGIELKCGGSSIVLTPAAIFIVGGPLVNINTSAGPPVAPVTAMATSPAAVLEVAEADAVDPGRDTRYDGAEPEDSAGADTTGSESADDSSTDEDSWIEIELVDEADGPVAGEHYEIIGPDGSTIKTGTLDANGLAHVAVTDPGTCQISFPNLDCDAWERI